MKMIPDVINKLISRFQQEPLQVRPGQCLSNRLRQAECKKCQEVCPRGVITFPLSSELDQSNCIGCGLCTAACPTGAVEMQLESDEVLLARIDKHLEKGSNSIRFCCTKGDSPQLPGYSKVEIPCLGRLNEGILAGAAFDGAKVLWLDSSQCQECNLTAGIDMAGRVIETTCDLCEQCVFFCPTGALAKREGHGKAAIHFRLSNCVGCGLCRLACDKQAISYLRGADTSCYQKHEPLIAYNLRKCQECGQVFGTSSAEKLCRICRRRAQLFGENYG
jgi:ferredoxin